MEVYNYDIAVGNPHANLEVIDKDTEYEHRRGNYDFEKGSVDIYADPYIVTFSFIYKGRYYCQTISSIKKPLTDLGIKRLAGKFARRTVEKREILGAKPNKKLLNTQ